MTNIVVDLAGYVASKPAPRFVGCVPPSAIPLPVHRQTWAARDG
jgi:hypothetical protein